MRETNTTKSLLLALTAVLLLAAAFGCGPESELGGVELVNALPDTRITGSPPYLRDAEYTVQFYWTGSDPDGRVRGFQWKMTVNGNDGISIRDTLTVDPATGDTINPWHFTTSNDSIFVVSADQAGFGDDAILPEPLQRFYQPHSLIIRAIDDQGGVDPTPAIITFTATTLAPTIRLTTPPLITGSYTEAQNLPPNFILGWTGSDPDNELGNPVQVRYLFKQARVADNSALGYHYVSTKYEFDQVVDSLVSFSDPQWSAWRSYDADPALRRQAFQGSKRDANDQRIYYLFAMQAKDIAGAVNIDRGYFTSVINFRIDDTKSPLLILRERFLGTETGSGLFSRKEFDIAQDQPLEFEWYGTAETYGGEVTAYRYGWDVDDLENDADPGWAVQFGLSPANRKSVLRTFAQGIHVLTVECIDNSGLKTRFQYLLSVVPVPEAADRRPLLLIDDVRDQTSNGWPSRNGTIKYDRDVQRDDFWNSVLTSTGGVSGYNSARDVIDNEDVAGLWGYRNVVQYRTLVWSARLNPNTYLAANFQPTRIVPQGGGAAIPTEAYVWLDAYQRNVGNVLLAGSGAVQNFHIDLNNIPWLYPIVYDNTEDAFLCGSAIRGMSFGVREESDGTETVFGTLQYPYRGLGFSITSMAIPQNFYYSPSSCGLSSNHRKSNCMGTKAVVLDPAFKAGHVQSGAFADTILVWDQIDWSDADVVAAGGIPNPASPFTFSLSDEYYDYNETARRVSWQPQTLSDGTPSIEPMWRAMPRYDWILDLHLANGEDDFTYPASNPCGNYARNAGTGRTVINGVPIGVFSYQSVATKPGGKADVIWGFDPHLYDHTKMKQALRWVLGEHFGLAMSP